MTIRGVSASAIAACLLMTPAARAATTISIVNGSFEQGNAIANGQRLSRAGAGFPGWKAASLVTVGRANLSQAQLPQEATDGLYVGYLAGLGQSDQQIPIRQANDLAQTLDIAVAANTRYTLTVDIGNALGQQFAGFNFGLVAGDMEADGNPNTLLAQKIGNDSPDGLWTTYSLTFDTGAQQEGLGRPLSVFLRSTQGGFQTHFTYFDNVRLTAESLAVVPEPATWGMMVLGFGVAGGAVRRRYRSIRAAAAA